MQGVTGEGAQCDELAGGNELIKKLQAKSALTKDKYVKETLDRYNEHNFRGNTCICWLFLDNKSLIAGPTHHERNLISRVPGTCSVAGIVAIKNISQCQL